MRQGGVMKIADAEAFGNELRTRRKELGYTQLISLNLQDLVSALYLIWKEERKRVRLERRLRL